MDNKTCCWHGTKLTIGTSQQENLTLNLTTASVVHWDYILYSEPTLSCDASKYTGVYYSL